MEKQIQKKSKSISWYRLFQKIKKQPLHKTRNTTVQVLIDGAMQDCSLIFTDSGKHFYLKPVSAKSRFTDGMSVIRDGDDADDVIRCPHCRKEIATNDDADYFGFPAHCEYCGTKLIR